MVCLAGKIDEWYFKSCKCMDLCLSTKFTQKSVKVTVSRLIFVFFLLLLSFCIIENNIVNIKSKKVSFSLYFNKCKSKKSTYSRYNTSLPLSFARFLLESRFPKVQIWMFILISIDLQNCFLLELYPHNPNWDITIFPSLRNFPNSTTNYRWRCFSRRNASKGVFYSAWAI